MARTRCVLTRSFPDHKYLTHSGCVQARWVVERGLGKCIWTQEAMIAAEGPVAKRCICCSGLGTFGPAGSCGTTAAAALSFAAFSFDAFAA